MTRSKRIDLFVGIVPRNKANAIEVLDSTNQASTQSVYQKQMHDPSTTDLQTDPSLSS